MLLSLNPYRASINPSILVSSAEELLAHAGSVESLKDYLRWEPVPEVLQQGFAGQKDAVKLLNLIKGNRKRRQLKERRLARGYANFIEPRKGIKGWWQKKFYDGKELTLPNGFDIMDWLHRSPRYLLLSSLHDVLISFVSSAEPRRVELEDICNCSNPVVNMIEQNDLASAERLVKAMTVPLAKVPPDFLVECLSGYVVNYDRKKTLAYYLG